MKRFLIISLCITNVIIACGLLWYTFGREKQGTQFFPLNESGSDAESLSDEVLWEKTLETTNLQSARNYLNQIKDKAYLQKQLRQRIDKLLAGTIVPSDRWLITQLIIQSYGLLVEEPEELLLLGDLTLNQNLPLTFRDRAFRTFIESSPRFKETDEVIAMSFDLIDRCFLESNILKETSLRAEQFLAKQGVERPQPSGIFQNRLETIIHDSNQPTSERITALNILSERNDLALVNLEKVFRDSDRQIRTSILEAISKVKEPIAVDWLQTVTPETPRQEELLQALIHP
ncbi:MAG: HEAT repeat domain-containing protein [Verrucomicrobiota bacterium]